MNEANLNKVNKHLKTQNTIMVLGFVVFITLMLIGYYASNNYFYLFAFGAMQLTFIICHVKEVNFKRNNNQYF